MTDPFGPENIGVAEISPSAPVVAGSMGTWTLRYTAGAFGIDDGGHIRIAHRQVSDWQMPQFDKPAESGFTTVRSNADLVLRPEPLHNAHKRPFRRALQIDVHDGALKPGDWIEVVFGDGSRGALGLRAQSYSELRSEFRVFVDAFGANSYEPVVDQPWLEVIGGPATRFDVTAPSDALVGRPLTVAVRATDAWGNTDSGFTGELAIRANLDVDGLPPTARFSASDDGVLTLDGVVPRKKGALSIEVEARDPACAARSNVVRCHEEAHRWTLYWGDLHGQTMETVGVNPAREYLRFARDEARIDFIGHQGNDFQITREFWAELTELMKEFHEPGRFVTFLGYEWSGNTPAGGDRNVHFLGDEGSLHRSSHALVDDMSDVDTDRCPVSRLYETFEGRDDVLLVPHVGGRRANFDYFEPSLEPVVEVHSSHGSFEWFGLDAVRRGYRVGFICASDVHTGKPGASRPSAGTGMEAFGVRGGLGGIYAESLTRESLWEALKSRRCYGTTGDRIAVWFECNGEPMGGDISLGDRLAFQGAVHGTAPIQSVEILRAGAPIFIERPRSGDKTSRRIRVTWTGADGRGRRRGTNWDGGLSIEGGSIASAETVGFDHPGERITHRDSSSVRWKSGTAGDLDGIELEIDRREGAALVFDTGPARFAKSLDELEGVPWRFDAGATGRWVELECVDPALDTNSVEIRHTLAASAAVEGAYYLRVVQKDCEMAWTSPVYVDKP